MDMMNSIILGIVQGLTEFLPISSSGHLIIARDFLNIQVFYGLAFDSVLQLATTLAVLVYFWKDILKYTISFFKLILGKLEDGTQKILVQAIIVGTVPGVILGLFLEDLMDTLFRDVRLVILTLVVGAIIMFVAEKTSKQNEKLKPIKGFTIGLYQALALIPGMSRSGMTIAGGLRAGLNREEATRFSFLLAFPILAGAGLKKLIDISSSNIFEVISSDLLIGSVVSFIVGILAIHFLVKFLKTHTLNTFVVYRLVLALVLILFLM